MAEEIINRVNQSGLTQIDLEEVRVPGERVFIDIKDQLFQGIALREKDFREFIAEHDGRITLVNTSPWDVAKMQLFLPGLICY